MVLKQLILMLEETAASYARAYDNLDFDLEEQTGGSVEGAYNLGITEGEIIHSRKLLELLRELKDTNKEVEQHIDC